MLEQVRDECRPSPVDLLGAPGKFHGERPFVIYMWQQLSEAVGNADEEGGDVQFGGYHWRVGKRLWWEDNFGFVHYHKFETEEQCKIIHDKNMAAYNDLFDEYSEEA